MANQGRVFTGKATPFNVRLDRKQVAQIRKLAKAASMTKDAIAELAHAIQLGSDAVHWTPLEEPAAHSPAKQIGQINAGAPNAPWPPAFLLGNPASNFLARDSADWSVAPNPVQVSGNVHFRVPKLVKGGFEQAQAFRSQLLRPLGREKAAA